MSTTAVEPEVTPEENEWLMQRLRPFAADSSARTKFLNEAIAAVADAHARGEHLDVDQFGATGAGKSPPLDIARASLQQILTRGGTSKAKAYRRWYVVLSLLDGRAGPASRNGDDTITPSDLHDADDAHPDPEGRTALEQHPRAEPEPEAERVEGDSLRRAADLQAEVERAQAAAAQQKERADRLESNNRVLKDRVKTAEETAERMQHASNGAKSQATRERNKAKAATEELDRVRELLGRVAGSEGKSPSAILGELLGEEEQLDEAAEHEAIGTVDAALLRPGGFRDELGTYLIQLLGTTEFEERPPQWLLDRVDQLAGL